MAKYKRRPKVKRYRRSFYSRGMRIRKIVGIVVLVAVVLAAAVKAAGYPHLVHRGQGPGSGSRERIPRGGILPGSGFGSRVGGCFLGGIGAGRGRL